MGIWLVQHYNFFFYTFFFWNILYLVFGVFKFSFFNSVDSLKVNLLVLFFITLVCNLIYFLYFILFIDFKFEFTFLFASITFYVNGLNILFVLLTNFCLFFICLLGVAKQYKLNVSNAYFLSLCLVNFLLSVLFLSKSLFVFFICYELLIWPIIVITGFYGTNIRRFKAIRFFLCFSILSAVIFLLIICCLFYYFGTTDVSTLKLIFISDFALNVNLGIWKLIFWCLLFVFIIKIPSIPFHFWLPEIHVEAPVFGSIILAAVYLKIGCYGILQFVYFLFPEFCILYQLFLISFFAISVVLANIILFRVIDLKRFIAYTSILHINFAICCLFSISSIGFVSAVLIFFVHSITSFCLFFLVGVLYNRIGVYNILYVSGLNNVYPIRSSFFIFFIVINSGFPVSLVFLSELFGVLSIVKSLPSFFIGFVVCLSFLINSLSHFRCFSRICFGSVKFNLKQSNLDDLIKFDVRILCRFSFVAVFMFVYCHRVWNIFYYIFLAKVI